MEGFNRFLHKQKQLWRCTGLTQMNRIQLPIRNELGLVELFLIDLVSYCSDLKL